MKAKKPVAGPDPDAAQIAEFERLTALAMERLEIRTESGGYSIFETLADGRTSFRGWRLSRGMAEYDRECIARSRAKAEMDAEGTHQNAPRTP